MRSSHRCIYNDKLTVQDFKAEKSFWNYQIQSFGAIEYLKWLLFTGAERYVAFEPGVNVDQGGKINWFRRWDHE